MWFFLEGMGAMLFLIVAPIAFLLFYVKTHTDKVVNKVGPVVVRKMMESTRSDGAKQRSSRSGTSSSRSS